MNRPRRPWRGAPAALLCLLLSGCALGSAPGGAGSAPGHTPVSLSLIAPTSGATVGVRQIEVVGTVVPANAAVLVAGHPAPVSHGKFTRTLLLRRSTTTIPVTAAARGYVTSTVRATVRYSAGLAAQLTNAHHALWTVPPAAAPGPSTSLSTDSGVSDTADRLPDASSHSGAHESTAATKPATAPRSATTPKTSSAPSSGTSASAPRPNPTPPSSKPTPPSSKPTPPSSTPTSPSSTPAPAASPGPTTADIKQEFITGCLKGEGGSSASAYCTCTYNHLAAAKAFASKAAIESMERALKRYAQTQDPSVLPAFVRRAIVACASKLPKSPLPIVTIGHHRGAPSPSVTTTPSPAAPRSG